MWDALKIPDLADRAILVTGASTVAKAFVAQGARVAVHFNESRASAGSVLDEIRKAGGGSAARSTALRTTPAACSTTCRRLT